MDYALRVLALVRVPVRFSIYGPQEEPAYWAECQRLIAALPTFVEAVYCGSIQHKDVLSIFAKQDLFFFPTRGENFGHVIAEALAVGCPCVVTDETPWTPILEKGAGHVIRETEEITNYIVEVLTEGSSLTEGRRSNVIQTYSEWYEASPNQRSIFASLFKE